MSEVQVADVKFMLNKERRVSDQIGSGQNSMYVLLQR